MSEAQDVGSGSPVRVRDVGWGALAALCLISLSGVVVAGLWRLMKGDLAQVAGALVSGLLYWWIGMGAFRRTRWGRPRETASIEPPRL